METADAGGVSVALGHSVGEEGAKVWAATKEKAGQVIQNGKKWLNENPRVSAVGLCGLGVLMGWALGWATGKEEREDRYGCTHRFLTRWGRKLKLD